MNGDRLALTDAQRTSITQVSKRVSARRAILVDSLVIMLDAVHGDFHGDAVRQAWHKTAVDSYATIVLAVQEALAILTPQQRALMNNGTLIDIVAMGQINAQDIPSLLRGPQSTIQ